jgi:hypothetical protein
MPRPIEERRQHKRYKIDNSVSVGSLGIFQITDISRGGFCFKCPPRTPVADAWDTDILTSVISLERVPAKQVWVSLFENGSHQPLSTIVGVKFGKLTAQQESLLLRLLDNLDSSSSGPH